MLKVILTAVNSAWYQSNPALYYLRGALSGLPLRVILREFTLAEPVTDVVSALYRERPGVACFSAHIWNRGYLSQLLPALRKVLPELKFILGGPEAGAGVYGLGEADYVIRGPGEGALRALAEEGFSRPGGIYEQPAPHLKDIPFCYRKSDKPELQGKLVYYETSRGCPFRCAYCLSATDERREFRFDPDSAADRKRLYRELDSLLALSPRTIKFVDRSFNIQPRLARLIWEYAIGQREACEFHFEIYPNLLSEADISLLEKSPEGRIRFEAGIQTTNAKAARACGRNSEWVKTKQILMELRQRTAVCIHADLLAGLPGESLSSVLRSLDQLAPLLPHEIQLGLLKILPDTPMLRIARERGYLWLDDPAYQVLASDALSFGQMSFLQDCAKALNLYWNKEEFAMEWESLLRGGAKASQVLKAILREHDRLGLPLHSVAKQTRAEVFKLAAGAFSAD